MRPIYRKAIVITVDVVLAAYLVLAMVSFNKPDEASRVCTKVSINIEDKNANGFLTANEVKAILQHQRMYPLNRRVSEISTRQIEDMLKSSPFVKTAQCYVTQDNNVLIGITQRLPVVRVKSVNGDDYYLDENGGIMPNSKYTSDLIIVTGHVSKWFAKRYVVLLAKALMTSDFWKNQIVQVNILPDNGVELVPRVGNHIVFLGYLPQTKYLGRRSEMVNDFVNKRLTRLEKFYKYGLTKVGWNKYPYISLEFDNQIICKKAAPGGA